VANDATTVMRFRIKIVLTYIRSQNNAIFDLYNILTATKIRRLPMVSSVTRNYECYP